MKKLILALLLVLVVILSATVSAAIAQSVSNFRVSVDIIPGDLIIYSPPDFTTPTLSWGFSDVRRGYNYEITFNVANTSNATIQCNPRTIPAGVTWVDVRFTPASFSLPPGARQNVHIYLGVKPDAPLGSSYFDIDFRGQ